MSTARHPNFSTHFGLLVCGLAAMTALTACAPDKPKAGVLPSKSSQLLETHPGRSTLTDTITTPSGLRYVDTKVGDGAVAHAGQTVSVHYTGWLYNDGEKGKKFDSSLDRGKPFKFALGAGQVIRGWDEGVAGMNVGGKRTLILPSELGYGARGAGADIPPNATLIFEVELLGVEMRAPQHQ